MAFRAPDEAFAAAAVGRALGAEVVQLDVAGSLPRTIDAEIRYPDGRLAGLEITSVEPREAHWLRGRMKGREITPAPGRLTWSIHPENVEDLDRLRSIHERVILIVELHGVARPDDLPLDVIAKDSDLEWVAWNSRSTMTGHRHSDAPVVLWLPPISIAVYTSEADEIAKGVAATLRVDPALDHMGKLLDDREHDERHLFLVVGGTGLSNAAALALIDPGGLPTIDPDVPEGVDHLWLGAGWGRTVTGAVAMAGEMSG